MKRPLLVTIISILMVITGIGQFVFGCLAVAGRNNATFLHDAGDISSSKVLIVGIVLLILGAVSILLGTGLSRGSRAVRGLVGLFEIVNIAGGVYVIVVAKSSRASGVAAIVGALVVLYFLFGTDKAKAFFAQ
ncbi:unannotated protein [freshwater metagenome]|uniref:Unannotated protein n=1 Tax=freshwater metagenome TaxID=449393 RepID=A0A6J7FHF7_9ZZZZ|nr:hypothetical protein [Actinomycetota bacterium]